MTLRGNGGAAAGTGGASLVFGIFASIAEFERELIRERAVRAISFTSQFLLRFPQCREARHFDGFGSACIGNRKGIETLLTARRLLEG